MYEANQTPSPSSGHYTVLEIKLTFSQSTSNSHRMKSPRDGARGMTKSNKAKIKNKIVTAKPPQKKQ